MKNLKIKKLFYFNNFKIFILNKSNKKTLKYILKKLVKLI